jgi:hypothetical protein
VSTTVCRVDLCNFLPDFVAVLEYWHSKPCDPLIRKLTDVLRIVEKRDGVVIGAEQEDLPAELDEAFE